MNSTVKGLGDDWLLLNLMGILCGCNGFGSVFFFRLGRFSAIICSYKLSAPFSFSFSSGTPMIGMLLCFKESLSSLSPHPWSGTFLSFFSAPAFPVILSSVSLVCSSASLLSVPPVGFAS